ncbi:MAG: hypothetical protein HYR56_05230 [Acidobacteria bacterium]|nr:hypothetical protein [Acidobacteriota bacterium]MBI3426656.1 hypothetical protein [Acidobacteriota bacterium]
MAQETFEILDGVRRAKSYELLGKPAIPAEVIDEDEHTIARHDVPIDALRVTTKRSIDVSTQKEWERFMKTFNEVKAGLPTPPILVTPGAEGRTIRELQLDPTGEDQ